MGAKVRSPVYRNLDAPFEIYGFSPAELIALVAVFVLAGELAEAAGLHRLWAFLAVGLAAACMHVFRRALGHGFFRRLVRFVRLPSLAAPALFRRGEKP